MVLSGSTAYRSPNVSTRRSKHRSPTERPFVRARPTSQSITRMSAGLVSSRPGSQATPAHHVSIQASRPRSSNEQSSYQSFNQRSRTSCFMTLRLVVDEPTAAIRSGRPHLASLDCHSSVYFTVRHQRWSIRPTDTAMPMTRRAFNRKRVEKTFTFLLHELLAPRSMPIRLRCLIKDTALCCSDVREGTPYSK